MSSSDRPYGGTFGSRLDTGIAAATAQDGSASWADSMQRARTRHAAITRNLNTWTNYKSWSEQVKGNWEQGQDARKK